MNFSTIQITEGIYQIWLGTTSVFLIEDGDELVLLDSGWKWSVSRLKKCIKSLGYRIDNIRTLAITHHHPDHAGGIRKFHKPRTVSAMHIEDAIVVSGHGNMPGLINNWFGKALLNSWLYMLNDSPLKIDMYVKEDGLLLNSSNIEVIHTPGHTPGSLCFYIRSKNVMIVGDAMEYMNDILTPPSRIYSYDWEQSVLSIGKLVEYDFEILCFSHFNPIMCNGRQLLSTMLEEYGVDRVGK
jgi:glyoxylase-like metal-dependent hydrolase (beta-lactamase superfamily II)